MKKTLLILLTSCADLGYAKIKFVGSRDLQQACLFDKTKDTAKCVDMPSYLLEVDEHLVNLPEEEKQAMLFERDWMAGSKCQTTQYGQMCEAD